MAFNPCKNSSFGARKKNRLTILDSYSLLYEAALTSNEIVVLLNAVSVLEGMLTIYARS